MEKILVGLSGGVDSSVAALLLKQQGYDVSAAYIKTWSNETEVFADCPGQEDIDYAQAVCKQLDIPFEVVNLVETYYERIVQYMVDGYQRGVTPNPDIMCNREIKFGAFLDYALGEGFTQVATGHYCQKVTAEDGLEYIAEGADGNKDQSYFLAMVTPEQLKHARFPIGHLEKSKVREIAQANDLPNAARKDSQGICFLGKVKINEFLAHYIPDKPGTIVKHDGTVLGEHKGLHRYTIGQRKGIGIPSNSDFNAYVVVAKRLESNELVVAFDSEDAEGLYTESLIIQDHSYVTKPFIHNGVQLARPRYRDPKQVLSGIEDMGGGTYRVHFAVPQRALANGQILAFYEEDRLLGGGFMLNQGLN